MARYSTVLKDGHQNVVYKQKCIDHTKKKGHLYIFCLDQTRLFYPTWSNGKKRNKFIETDRNEHSFEDENMRGSLE